MTPCRLWSLLARIGGAAFGPLLLSLVFANGTPAFAQSGIACERVLVDESPRPSSLVMTAIGDESEPIYIPKGDIVGNENTRSLNQCLSSECYLFAFLGAIEVQNQNLRGDRMAPHLSGPYLFARKLLKYAEDAIWNGPERTEFSVAGGVFSEALLLSRRHGLVPEESWRPKVPFQKWDFAQLYRDLEQKGKSWNRQLSALAAKSGSWTSSEVTDAYFRGRADVQGVVLQLTGPHLPDDVFFRSRTVETKDLERRYGFDRRASVYMMYPANRFADDPAPMKKNLKEATAPFGAGWDVRAASREQIEKTTATWVNAGAPVVVDLTWGNDYHSMVVVDFERSNNRIVRWKLKNSWGPEFGEEGYAWYTADDLYRHLMRTWRIGSNAKPTSP